MSIAEFIYTEVLKPKPLKAFANAILLRIIPPTLKLGPVTLHLDLTDPVVSGALTLRVFEPSEIALFKKYCRRDMTLVDIGANIGLYTSLAIHSLNEKGQVIAFEPHPRSYSFLQKNIEANLAHRDGNIPRVHAFQLAAAPQAITEHLRLNPENRGDNRLYRGTYQGEMENWESIPVAGQPIDCVLQELGIFEVNFVKIDIQGYEQKAIEGFRDTLARSKQAIIMSEFWPQGLREAGGDARQYMQDLADLGFTLYELKERPRGKVASIDDWDRFIANLSGRKYTNIIGVKGYSLS